MIQIRNVNKSFADNHVLKDLTTTFKPGVVNMVIGRSGSGKSVLLKSLVGLHQIDSGEILFDERDFSKLKNKEKAEIRKEIGMLFQGSALFDSVTIKQNVLYPLELFTNNSFEKNMERVDFCLQRVGLTKAKELYPSELSGGMQKRAAIARAIALNPKYLFCDEPNSGLDPQTAIIIDKLIQEITYEYNITTIINTHDMNSVFAIADNVLYVYKGQLWWIGKKEELLNSDNKELNDFLYSSDIMKQLKNKIVE